MKAPETMDPPIRDPLVPASPVSPASPASAVSDGSSFPERGQYRASGTGSTGLFVLI